MFLDAYWVCQNKGSIFVLDQMGEKVGSERVMLLTCLLIREREREVAFVRSWGWMAKVFG